MSMLNRISLAAAVGTCLLLVSESKADTFEHSMLVSGHNVVANHSGCGCGSHQAHHHHSAPMASGCGCASGGCQGGGDLWAGYCSSGCQTGWSGCETGCGGSRPRFFQRLGLFRGAGNCCPTGVCNPMGWNLNGDCGGSFFGQCGRPRIFSRNRCNVGFNNAMFCNSCNMPRLLGRCGCSSAFTAGWNRGCTTSYRVPMQPCFDGSFVRDCGTGFRRLRSNCGGFFANRRRLRSCGNLFSCGNFRLFGRLRCDDGYTGCHADTAGCVGESVLNGTVLGEHQHHIHNAVSTPAPQPEFHSQPLNVQPYQGQPLNVQPPIQQDLQPVNPPRTIQPGLPLNPQPNNNGNDLPAPIAEEPPTTALVGPFGRQISFSVPSVEFPVLNKLFN